MDHLERRIAQLEQWRKEHETWADRRVEDLDALVRAVFGSKREGRSGLVKDINRMQRLQVMTMALVFVGVLVTLGVRPEVWEALLKLVGFFV